MESVVLKVVASLAQEAEGRYGELAPKGAQRHRGAERPGCSTVTRRCSVTVRMWMHAPHPRPVLFFSMAAGCVELKGLNPKLNVTTQTSEADAYYIKYKNPLYEAQHLENVDSVYRAADSVVCTSGAIDETDVP